ncbi:MAG: protein translocase subunit SecD, partial [Cyanobacteria bacterium J06628_4]
PTVDLAYAETGITGGSAVISGILSLEAAQELAIQLQSQALPVAVEMIAVETVMLTPECD